ncbi:acid-sensing ion channel 4-B-like [Hydractinia symbiolongicarpus]|uniref:acid-sensing ion channel 4-B-like n=1 Tax=Hydractinia symbiolongicarpus TaxID=13093 RepID=UPI002550372C|nr:acid-sensing ion channel 4-B-like [Hydractinia symbiolongicarpus]
MFHRMVNGNGKTKWQEKRKEYIDSCTLHGFSKACSARGLEKMLWFSLLVGSSVLICLATKNVIEKYQSREFFTETRSIYPQGLDLPSLTLCNDYRLLPKQKQNIKSFSEEFYRFAQFYPDFCTVGHQRCTIKEFKPFGKNKACFTFTPTEEQRQMYPGLFYGLQLFLFINKTKETVYGILDEDVRISIHEKNEIPQIFFNYIPLTSGTANKITIRKTLQKRLPSPYPSNCIRGHKHTSSIFPGHYTRYSCISSCFLTTSYEKCGGILSNVYESYVPDYIKNKSKSNTTDNEMERCLWKVVKAYGGENAPPICECQVPCEEIDYNEKTQTTPLSINGIRSSLKSEFLNDLTDEEILNSFYKINVFYQKFQYQIIAEKPAYSLTQAMGDFGGQVGLIFGASILTLIELFVIIFLRFK